MVFVGFSRSSGCYCEMRKTDAGLLFQVDSCPIKEGFMHRYVVGPVIGLDARSVRIFNIVSNQSRCSPFASYVGI